MAENTLPLHYCKAITTNHSYKASSSATISSITTSSSSISRHLTKPTTNERKFSTRTSATTGSHSMSTPSTPQFHNLVGNLSSKSHKISPIWEYFAHFDPVFYPDIIVSAYFVVSKVMTKL